MSKQSVEAIELLERLRYVNPSRHDEVVEILRDMVAIQEVLAAHRHARPLGAKRVEKKYSA